MRGGGAVLTLGPGGARLFAAGALQIFDGTMMPGEIVDVLVVHQDYMMQHPGIINQLVDGWFRTLAYMTSDQQEAYLKMSKRLGISPQQVRDSFELIILPDRKTNTELLAASDSELLATIKKLNRVLIKHQLLDSKVSTSDLLSNRFTGKDN